MDIYFLFFASFGVIVFGLSKGGFPGPISMLAVPIMSFAMNPLKAAGILLPLLLVMDVIALYLYWNKWDIKLLKIIIPSSNYVFKKNDTVILLSKRDQLPTVENMFRISSI